MREKKTRGGLFRDEAQHRCTPFDHAGGGERSPIVRQWRDPRAGGEGAMLRMQRPANVNVGSAHASVRGEKREETLLTCL